MNRLKRYIKIFIELCKVRITLFVALTTSVGYVAHSSEITWEMLIVSFGVFILASGSSSLNEFQEREYDAIMKRTKNRPIPAGLISSKSALIISTTLIIIGSGIIFIVSGVTAFLLGILAFVWYNFVYTPLKRKYAMAVIPGSLIGAIPPVIGWVAAGGSIVDSQILIIALFFFIWQIPHFWLLLLIYGNDYESAGYPTLTGKFPTKQLSSITFIWIAALAVSSLFIPLFDVSSNLFSLLAFIICGLWLLLKTKTILTGYFEKINFKKAFFTINLYVLVIILIISIDKLIFNKFIR